MVIDITITADQRDKLIRLACDCKPNEACAILYGRQADSLCVDHIHNVDNVDSSPVSFALSDADLLEAYRLAEQMDLDIIGIFHSHPDSDAYPSGKDQSFMAINPVVWTIYSVSSDKLRAYILDDRLKEIPVRVAQSI